MSSAVQSQEAAGATVTPNTDLVDGQSVTLTVTGFAPGTTIHVGQCAADAGDLLLGCTAIAVGAVTDANGSYTTTFTVRYEFTPNIGGRTIRCNYPGACVVGAVSASDDSDRRAAPITFRDVPPPPPPIVVVEPASDLQDLQEVTVRASNIPAGYSVGFAQCGVQGTYPDNPCQTLDGFATADAAGELTATIRVRHDLQPFNGDPPFTCSAPGSCNVRMYIHSGGLPPADSDPIGFKAIASPQRGQLAITPSSVPAGAEIEVQGSGWASNTSVLVSWCGTAGVNSPPLCRAPQIAFADASGAFSTPLTALGTWEQDMSFIDCTRPGACFVRAQDSRDESLAVDAALAVQTPSVPRGSAEIDLQSPLVAWMTVRLQGSGWQPGRSLRLLECAGEGYDTCQAISPLQTVASDGTFRVYATMPNVIGSPITPRAVYCAGPGCSVVVADSEAPGATAVRIPLTFVTSNEVQVTSYYETQWDDLFAQGMALSGTSAGNLQRLGAGVLYWLLDLSGQTTSTHLPRTGTVARSTTYAAPQYIEASRLAAGHDYTIEEAQKIGALFYAWLLAGQPPLPE